ncbi:MAG TPA: pseudouridine synthase [Burkholderiales bacterium]
MTLDRILQSQGFGTRRQCQALIAAGEVTVGGNVAAGWQQDLAPEGLAFTVEGEPWTYHARLYLALNKPAGIECSRKPSHHPGVLTLFPHPFTERGLQPVGRLDHDTTGLLLLSDDGTFIHAQSSPKRHVDKTYVATVAEPATPALVDQLTRGVKLDDEPAPLAARSARLLSDHDIEIVLTQGKYHQVKRMLAAAGNHCAALRREAIGQLTLASLELPLGAWTYLSEAQQQLLRAA